MKFLVHRLTNIFQPLGQTLHRYFIAWTKPAKATFVGSAVSDLSNSKAELMAENALLRQQLIVLNRQIKSLPLLRLIGSY